MASAQVQTPPVPTPPVVAPVVVEDSCCKKAMQLIQTIALQIFTSLLVAAAVYFTIPLKAALILMPLAITANLFVMNCFFEKTRPVEPKLPLPQTAPVGLANAGNDCWLNSLLQMIFIDRGLSKWFREVPAQLDMHATYFTYFSQQLLENLPAVLPPQAYGNLPVQDPGRAAIDRYANHIRAMSEAEKATLFTYTRFLRKFPFAMNPQITPRIVATTLVKCKEFMTVYEEGLRNRPGQVLREPGNGAPEPALYDSHALRMAIGQVCARINLDQEGDYSPHSQQDPTEAFPWISEYLFPDHLKIQMQERQHYDLPRNAAGDLQPISDVANGAQLLDGRVIVKNEDPTAPFLNHAIVGSFPNMQNFLERYFDEPNYDADNRIKRRIDGLEYTFPRVKTERQFLTAPSALWLPAKRFGQIQSQWVGLHRMIPSLFDAVPRRTVKIENSVYFQEIIEIQPVQGPLARYELDGFILQKGAYGGGHYVSYKRGVDDQGNRAWFLMDDSHVTRVTDQEMRAALEKAYIPHYSKMEE